MPKATILYSIYIWHSDGDFGGKHVLTNTYHVIENSDECELLSDIRKFCESNLSKWPRDEKYVNSFERLDYGFTVNDIYLFGTINNSEGVFLQMKKLIEDHEEYLKKTFLPTFLSEEYERLQRESYIMDLRYEELDKEYEVLRNKIYDLIRLGKKHAIKLVNRNEENHR